MAYNSVHALDAVHTKSYSPSVGATAVTAYDIAPIKGRLLTFRCVLGGALTTADATVTVTNVTTGVTVGTFTLIQSGSAAGSMFSGTPSTFASSLVNLDDVISIAATGASGASIPGHFKLAYRTF